MRRLSGIHAKSSYAFYGLILVFGLILIMALTIVVLRETRFGFSPYPAALFTQMKAEPRGSHQYELLLTGHIMGSFDCLGRLRARRSGQTLNLTMISPLMCGDQGGGDFSIIIPLDAPVNKVTFGREQVIIYESSKGRNSVAGNSGDTV